MWHLAYDLSVFEHNMESYLNPHIHMKSLDPDSYIIHYPILFHTYGFLALVL